MTTSYPGTVQSFTSITGATITSVDGHANRHNTTQDTVKALEDVLGTTGGISVLKSFTAGDFCAKTSDIPTNVGTLAFGTNLYPLGTSALGTTDYLKYNGTEIIGGTISGGGASGTALIFGTSTIPLSTTPPTSGQNLQYNGTEILGIYDLNLATPSSNLTANGIKTTFTANETQIFGDVVFINSGGSAQLINAGTIATMNGIAMCADGTITGTTSGNYLLTGWARKDAWNWTTGGKIYGGTAGVSGTTITQTAPGTTDQVIQILGVAKGTSLVYFKPELSQIEHI